MSESISRAIWEVWQCEVCGWIYDEEKGAPAEGIPPRTRWADVPDDWKCPECLAPKSDFVMVRLASPALESPEVESYRRNETPAEFKDNPIVIIGSGLAGYTLVKEIREIGAERRIVVVTLNDGASYPKPMLSNAIAAGRSAEDIASATAEEMARDYDIEVMTFRRVVDIDTRQRVVRLETGETIGYSRLVLATGSDCIELAVEGAESERVRQVNDLADFAAFRASLQDAKDVVIVGAGLIGCEFADDLSTAGYGVTVVEAAARPLQSLVPEDVSAAVSRALTGRGVRFMFERAVSAIAPSGDRVDVNLAGGDAVPADLVLVAIGVKPNTTVARMAGLAVNRGICVNRFLETTAIDVFALGDCAEIQQRVHPHVLPLVSAARALAATLCGRSTEVDYGVFPIHVKTPSVPVVCYRAPGYPDAAWVTVQAEGINCKCELRTASGKLVGVALSGSSAEEKNDYVAKLPPLMDEGFITTHGRRIPEYFFREPRGWGESIKRWWWGA